MTYSQARMPNDVDFFPEPPLWLVWFGDGHWSADEGEHVTYGESRRDRGQVRHCPTLAKARKVIAPYGRRTRESDKFVFYNDWAIYKWEGDEYVLKFSGQSGEKAEGHPLWQRGVPSALAKDDKAAASIPDRVIERTLASLKDVS